MIDHTGIGVANVARAAAVYDAARGALGMRRVIQMPENSGSDGIGYGIEPPLRSLAWHENPQQYVQY
jgi:hypothetical protein